MIAVSTLKSNSPPRVHQNFHNSSQPRAERCPFKCGKSHKATDCESFRRAEFKWDLIRDNNLCKNCLKGHPGKCSLRPGCQRCGKYHQTLLHLERPSTKGNVSVESTAGKKGGFQSRNAELKNHHTHVQQAENRIQRNNGAESIAHIAWDEPVLLATAIVLIRSVKDNQFYPFRALLDQASEASYIFFFSLFVV